MFCLNVDGSKNWDMVEGTGFYSSPAIGPEKNLYVGSWDGYMYSFNETGSAINWPSERRRRLISIPLLLSVLRIQKTSSYMSAVKTETFMLSSPRNMKSRFEMTGYLKPVMISSIPRPPLTVRARSILAPETTICTQSTPGTSSWQRAPGPCSIIMLHILA